jgi:cobalamin synthase
VLLGLAVAAREPAWIAAGLVACGASLVVGRSAARRLGGVLVGDVYGATIVGLDVALLAAIALLQGH